MKKLLRLSPVILILVLILAVTARIDAQAGLQVIDLTVNPQVIKVGDTVTISATVKNTRNEKANFTLTLKIDNEIVDTREITLNAGASETVDFAFTATTPGPHTAELNGNVIDFTVKGASFWSIFPTWLWITIGVIISLLLLLIIILVAIPPRRKQPEVATKAAGVERPAAPDMQMPTSVPTFVPGPAPTIPSAGFPTTTPTPGPGVLFSPGISPTPCHISTPGPATTPYPPTPFAPYTGRPIFSISNLTITPNQVKAGEPVTISAIVSNNGSQAGRYSVVLRINGLVENITEIALPPGGSQATTFTVIKEDGGEYYAELDGLGGSFIVIPLVPAHFSVTNLVITPERVKQGERVNISAIVTNHGELKGDHSLALKLKGAVETVEQVSLGPGESRQVTFNVVKTTPGFYNVELEGLTGRFVVEMEWQV